MSKPLPSQLRTQPLDLGRPSFPEAVAEMQATFDGMADRDLHQYILAPERCVEAGRVVGCVERAVLGELDPSGALAISRYTFFSPPGLGDLLQGKGKYDSTNLSHREVIRGAVRRTLAVGWLFSCHPEAPTLERSEREIWAAWAPSVRESLDGVIDKALARMIHDAGRDILVGELKAARMTRMLGGSQLHQVAFHLAQAGYYLRMTQSPALSDDLLTGAARKHERVADEGLAPARWQWDAYGIDSSLSEGAEIEERQP